jgi:hypothetical protein
MGAGRNMPSFPGMVPEIWRKHWARTKLVRKRGPSGSRRQPTPGVWSPERRAGGQLLGDAATDDGEDLGHRDTVLREEAVSGAPILKLGTGSPWPERWRRGS